MEKLKIKSAGELQKEIRACENIIKVQQEEITKTKTEKHISSEKIDEIVSKIENSLEKRLTIIEEKIDAASDEKVGSSYAQVTKQNLPPRAETIKHFLEKEKEEQKWIKTTSRNLIFHNVVEILEDSKETTEKDDNTHLEEYVFPLILRLKGIKVMKTERIGTFTPEKDKNEDYRPLKVTFQNEDDKEKVLKTICKRGCMKYRVTEDLSKNERDLVKEWCRKARELNSKKEDENFQWKVRGSPRTGLYMKKVFRTQGQKS